MAKAAGFDLAKYVDLPDRVDNLQKAIENLAIILEKAGLIKIEGQQETPPTSAPPLQSTPYSPSPSQHGEAAPAAQGIDIASLAKAIIPMLTGGGGGEIDNFYKMYAQESLRKNLVIQDKYMAFLDALISGQLQRSAQKALGRE